MNLFTKIRTIRQRCPELASSDGKINKISYD